MSDWLKGFDPLKNLGASRSSRSSMDSLRTGLQVGSAIGRMFQGRRERQRMEREHDAEVRHQNELLRAPPPLHGSAAWATADELRHAGILQSVNAFNLPSSLLLGTFLDPDSETVEGQLHWDGEGHLLTIAPTRTGKSAMLIVANLLRYQGSCVVLDPKGELYRDTAGYRSTIGPVYRIAPAEDDSHGFNPMASIRSFGDARALAEQIIPTDPRASEFFKKDAVAFLAALIYFVHKKSPPEFRTLAEVRKISAFPTEQFLAACKAMAASGIPAVVDPVNVVLGKRKDGGLTTMRESLNGDLSLFSDPGVIAATSSSDVDFRSLKDRPATVYITVPFEKMDAYAPVLKIILTSALQAMTENPRMPEIPVLFVLDEFLALGPFPKFRDAIRTHAGAGVRLWFFLQDVSTLEDYYPTSWKAFFNASVKIVFGVDEIFTGKLISDLLGDTTVAYAASNRSAGSSAPGGMFGEREGSASGSISHHVAFQGRPLLTPTEVVQLLSRVMPDKTRVGLLFMRGVPPIKARLVPWYIGQECRKRSQLPILKSSQAKDVA